MDIQTASTLLNLTAGTYSAKDIKKAYKVVSIKFHPDKNKAGAEMMQAINEAYNTLKGLESVTVGEVKHNDYADILNEALNSIINCDGLEIEVCGSWVWVGGNTKDHKDVIKGAGFFWAKKKAKWYYRPAEFKASRRRNTYTMDQIRENHGTKTVKTQKTKALVA